MIEQLRTRATKWRQNHLAPNDRSINHFIAQTHFPRRGCLPLLGILCLPLLGWLYPHLKPGRQELRLMLAYYEVRLIRDALLEIEETNLPENDPWGNPYRVETLPDGHVRLISSGPNGTSPETGVDEDDIHSDLAVSPAEPIQAKKRQQGRNAFAVTLLVWIAACFLYWRLRPAGTSDKA